MAGTLSGNMPSAKARTPAQKKQATREASVPVAKLNPALLPTSTLCQIGLGSWTAAVMTSARMAMNFKLTERAEVGCLT